MTPTTIAAIVVALGVCWVFALAANVALFQAVGEADAQAKRGIERWEGRR